MIHNQNRKEGPGFELPGVIGFLPVNKFSLANSIDVSFIEAGSQDVTKIDWVFPAGAVQADKPLLASTVGNLLVEGTKTKTANEIADFLDFYGAYFSSSSYYHNSVVSLFCLTKDLPQLLPLMEDIIKNPSFLSSEIENYLNKRREEYLIDSEKVRTLAARKFHETVFGSTHPYGRLAQLEDFSNLDRNDLEQFHRDYYLSGEAKIIVAGQPGKEIYKLLDHHFGRNERFIARTENTLDFSLAPSHEKFHFVEKRGAVQSALRIGRPIFNNTHPDFIPLMVVNTILGGYFGSRLMTSVREEKGLTHGIGSSLISYKESGLWMIVSEVAGEMRDQAVEAIFEEMMRLTKEPVSEDELDLVRNFMLGEMLRYFDGPFSTSDIYRTLQENQLDFDFYAKMEKEIRNITSHQIIALARKYLQSEEFYVVVAGK